MNQDPEVLAHARSHLSAMFEGIGHARQEQDPTVLGILVGDLEEFMTMPMDLARLFTEMAFDLSDLVLQSLAEAGIILVKGLTPA